MELKGVPDISATAGLKAPQGDVPWRAICSSCTFASEQYLLCKQEADVVWLGIGMASVCDQREQKQSILIYSGIYFVRKACYDVFDCLVFDCLVVRPSPILYLSNRYCQVWYITQPDLGSWTAWKIFTSHLRPRRQLSGYRMRWKWDILHFPPRLMISNGNVANVKTRAILYVIRATQC